MVASLFKGGTDRGPWLEGLGSKPPAETFVWVPFNLKIETR